MHCKTVQASIPVHTNSTEDWNWNLWISVCSYFVGRFCVRLRFFVYKKASHSWELLKVKSMIYLFLCQTQVDINSKIKKKNRSQSFQVLVRDWSIVECHLEYCREMISITLQQEMTQSFDSGILRPGPDWNITLLHLNSTPDHKWWWWHSTQDLIQHAKLVWDVCAVRDLLSSWSWIKQTIYQWLAPITENKTKQTKKWMRCVLYIISDING